MCASRPALSDPPHQPRSLMCAALQAKRAPLPLSLCFSLNSSKRGARMFEMQIDAGRVRFSTSSANLAQRQDSTYRCRQKCKLSSEGFCCLKRARCNEIRSSLHSTSITSNSTTRVSTKVQSFLCYTLAKEKEGVVEVFNYAKENVGVLLLNLGGPETLEDVQPFLYNLFADPDIIRLPRLLRFLQQPLAQFISMMRAPKSMEGYASIGGGSPLRRITEEQANALRVALEEKSIPAKVYVGMRYWHPFTEEAIRQIKKDRISKLVVLPLYPQFSISTSGSSLRLLEEIFREDEYLVNMQHTVIPSWYQREGYVKSMATLIQSELQDFKKPQEVMIFFSAHGVPRAYVEEAGDPYKDEMEHCVRLIIMELRLRGIPNDHTLAYQSRVGPVEWLKPYTDDTIKELGRRGVKSLLAVPISFVSEHIETLEEIDVEYRELALESGITNWGRVPALGCEQNFIRDLADAVIEALPYVGAMAVSNIEARQSLIPLGSVGELLATYDTQRRELPPPVPVWKWGWTKSAETWNGRAAMLAVLALLLLEVSTGQGILHQIGILPLFR